MAELSAELMTQPDRKQKYLDSVDRYKSEKQEIKVKAEELEKESLAWEDRSESQMHQHHRWLRPPPAFRSPLPWQRLRY